MNYTANYNLNKPEYTDNVDVAKLNENADIIDAKLKEHSDALELAAFGIKYRGEVNYYADLPLDAEIGDAYTVKYSGSSGTTPDGTEYVWGNVGGSEQWIDFSKDCYTRAEVDALLTGKQDTLNAAQLAAVNSGITSESVTQIETNKNNILWNTQNGVKNIFNPKSTIAGDDTVSVTRNEDGSITLNTSAPTTRTAYIYLNDRPNFIVPVGTWTLSGSVVGYNSAQLAIYNNSTWATSNGVPSTITFDSPSDERIIIRIGSGISLNNVTLKPMVCRADLYNADPTYQPYALSNADLTTLSAEDRAALVEIVDGGAKNDLEFNYISGGTAAGGGTTWTSNGVTFTLNPDNSITVNRVSSSESNAVCQLYLDSSKIYIDSLCDNNHVLSGCPDGGSDTTFLIGAHSGSYAMKDTGEGAVLLPTTQANVYLQITIMATYSPNNLVFKPMICTKAAWDISHAYQPHRPSYQELYERIVALEQANQ